MTPRLSAIEALVRGFANFRSNWEVAVAQALSGLLLGLLALASLVPIGFALGFGLADLDRDPLGSLARVLDPALWWSGPVIAALLVGLLVGTAAIAVYSWFQAGIFGVLVEGDRRAGSGSGSATGGFRVFSWSDFSARAGRGLFRFFGWYHLYLAFGTVLLALFGAVLVGALQVGVSRGVGAGVGVGCGGLVPLVVLSLLCSLWFQAAKSDLAREESSALRSWSRGARVVGHRIGASLLLLLLFVTASSALAMLFLPLQMAADLGLRGSFGAFLASQVLVSLLQWLLGTVLGVVYGASFVALVRSELPDAAG